MAGTKTIFKVNKAKRNEWTQVLNATIRDDRISFRATGLLVFLLSLPDDWCAHQQHISTCKREGRDAVVSAWNELRQCGYIEKELVREKGKIVTTVWNIYEEPCSRLTGKPETVEPETVLPKAVNPVLQKKEGEEIKKVQRRSVNKGRDALSLIPEVLNQEKFLEAWVKWEIHRNQLRVSRYTEQGATEQFKRLSEMGIDAAVLAINHSIAQNYRGIFPDLPPAGNGSRNGNGHKRDELAGFKKV